LLKNYGTSPLAVRETEGHEKKEKSMNSNNTIYFLMGIGIGVAAGILYAPRSGPETRDFLKSKSEQGARYARQTASDAIDPAKQKADELRQTTAGTIDHAIQAVKGPVEA
jgi:gas vesicle protein